MKSLACLVIGDGRLVTVRIEGFYKVGDLVNLLEEKHPSIISCGAADVTLWVAKEKNSGAWLKSGDVKEKKDEIQKKIHEIKTSEQNKMDVAYRLNNSAFGFPEEDDEDAEDGVVHVLVEVPVQNWEMKKVSLNRKRRWKVLNVLLARKKAKHEADEAMGLFRLSSEDADGIIQAGTYQQASKAIPNEKLELLHGYLAILDNAFGGVLSVNERKHFILPVLACVCSLFDGDARIQDMCVVVGERVHGCVAFDFIIERGDKRVCVMEAKNDDIQQSLAQAYVGTEILADVEGLTEVYSVVTNFVEWYFSRTVEEGFERSSVMNSNHASLKTIAEKIYAMLSDGE